MIHEPPSAFQSRRSLDQFGIGVAGLCALHCVVSIVLVSGLGLGSHFLLEPAIHEIGLALAFVLASIAIGWGAMRHRRVEPFAVALTGLVCMGASFFVAHGSEEFLLSLVGVTLVAAGHVLNIRLPRLP